MMKIMSEDVQTFSTMCQLILRTSSDRLTANFCCNDSGSNIQLISLQTLVAMGGEKKRINKVKSSIENSSGHNTLVIGEREIEIENAILYTYKCLCLEEKDMVEDERRRETKTNPRAGAVSQAMCSKLRVPCRFVTEHPCCKLPQDIGMLGR